MIKTDLPHSLEAEQSVLGGIFIKPSAFAEVSAALVVDDFLLPAHREIFEAMLAIDKRGGPPADVIAVADELRVRGMLPRLDGGEGYLLALSNAVPTAENIGHYARLVKEKSGLRRVIAACVDAAAQAKGDADLDDILGELRRSVAAVELSGEASGTVRVGDVQARAEEALEGRFENPDQWVVSTGLRSLDSVLGGLKAGQQIVIASNPGQGKTSLAWTTLIRAALHKVPALLFSLEMGLQEMIERAWTFLGEVPGLGYQRPDKAQWQKIRTARNLLQEIPLFVNDRKLRLDKMLAEARAWRAKHDGRLALVAVDYLGLVNAKEKGRNREQEVATVSTECKRLAGDLKCPVILVAQLNRENVKGGAGARRPVMSDLRDSGAVEQDADVIVFPWAHEGVTRLIIEKHRNGKTGAVRVNFQRDLMAFYDLPYEHEWHEAEGEAA